MKQNQKSFYIKKEQKEITDRITKDNWTLCETEESKEIREKKETNERLIKDRIIRDIQTLFEQVGD